MTQDRKKGGPTPLAWSLVGLVLAVVGLSIFALDLLAFLDGQRSVRLSSRPWDSRSISVEVQALFGLLLGLGGIATLWRGLILTYPKLADRWWIRWSARLVIVPLFLLTIALAALVVATRTGLL